MALIRCAKKAVTDMIKGIQFEYYTAGGGGNYQHQTIQSGTAITKTFGYGFSFMANCKDFTDLNVDPINVVVGFKDGVGTQLTATNTTHYNLTNYDYVYGLAAKSANSNNVTLTFT